MAKRIERGEMFFEAHAICGKCERRIRIVKKVSTMDEAEDKLKEANWVKTEQSGWICFICRVTPERELG